MSAAQQGGQGHRYLEHTADIGIGAWGPDLRAAFGEAAVGLCTLMVDPASSPMRPARRDRSVSVAASADTRRRGK